MRFGQPFCPSKSRAIDMEALVIIAGDMFASGYDTKDISLQTVTPESKVLSALHIARQRQFEGHRT